MKISAFTMVRNAEKYYFPIKESILSVLPIVDEVVVALGKGDKEDNTAALIQSIQSDKIKIYHRQWSEDDFVDGRIFAQETNFARAQCSGDWCIYLQADELIHEKDHPQIVQNCRRFLSEDCVDGFLFDYYHFYGDYKHHLPVHGWYKNEIRIIRNKNNIYSYKDAQSFRKDNNTKLDVVHTKARIYHYGWVRPPHLMQSKKKEQDSMHHGIKKAEAQYKKQQKSFDYGALGRLDKFKEPHPRVMLSFIRRLDWQSQLNYTKTASLNRHKLKHEKWKYRVLTFLEKHLNKGADFWGYSNWNLIDTASIGTKKAP